MPPEPTPLHRTPPRRGRGWPLAVTAAVGAAAVALVAAGVVAGITRDGPMYADPVIQVTARDGVVIASGQGFPSEAPAVVSARLSGGSASAWVPTTDTGTFEVAFRPPAGFEGEVAVSAASGSFSTEGTAVAPGPDATPTAEPSSPGQAAASDAATRMAVIPTTGSPARDTLTLAPSGLPIADVPAAIADDCSTDVTEPLNAWLASVPDGSEIVFGREACYLVDGRLELIDRSTLVIEGNGATFRAEESAPAQTNRSQWYLEYGNDLSLRNMTLIGVNPEPVYDVDHEWDHNLFIRGTDTVSVENVHGQRAYGDFIAIAQGPDDETIPSDITIRNVSADIVGRMGISCVACDGVSVEDSVFNDVAYHVFDLEIQGDDWPGRSIEYTGNTIGRHGWAFFAVGTPFQTFRNDISDLRISGNVMTMPGFSEDCRPALSFQSSKIDADGVIIEDNVLLSRTTAIDVRRASDVVIRDNAARLAEPTCGDPVGIRVTNVDGADVSGNELTGYVREQEVEP